MVSPKQIVLDRRGSLIQINKPHLLLVSDSAEGLKKLRELVDAKAVEIAEATYINEPSIACDFEPHAALVDIRPEHLVDALRALRSNLQTAAIPILVEADRIAAARELAGILPGFRAMPCRRNQMAALALRNSKAPTAGRIHRGIL